MKSWVLHGVDDIRFEDIELPALGDDEALVKVKAAGICGSDIPRIFHDGAHNMPLIPGHEFAGIITEVGRGVNSDWNGKKVGIFPLIPCERCMPCKMGHSELCRNYSYLGSRRDGGFAEYVAVPVKNLLELPDGIGFDEAAMLEPMAVAVHAIRIGIGEEPDRLPLDSKIIVCGLGTIGLLVVMVLRDAGYNNISVIGNKDTQKKRVGLLGINQNLFYDSKEWSEGNVDPSIPPADLYFECTGRRDAFSYGLKLLGPLGRMVTVGNPTEEFYIDRNDYWKILRN